MDRLELLLSQMAAADARGRGGPADGSARWRLELERAQWQLRRSQPAAASERSAAAAPQQEAVHSRARTATHAAFPVDKPAASIPAGKGMASEAPMQPGQAAAGGARAGSGDGTGSPMTQGRLRQDRGASPNAPAERAPRPQRVVWPRVNAHAMLRGETADVWIRDAALDESARRRLKAELAARLRAAGLRPGALFLNGEEIPY